MKIRNHVLMAALTAMLAGSIAGQGAVATAHTYTDWMGKTWPSTDRTAEWKFTTNVPTGTNFRNRVKDAAFTWNAEGQSMTFSHQQGDVSPSTAWCGSSPTAMVDYTDIADTAHASAAICSAEGMGGSASHMASFKITFDSSSAYFPNGWYNDLTLNPNGTRDTQGIATHEFGHATGRCCLSTAPTGGDTHGHFVSGYGLCPQSVDYHTMCDGVSGSWSWYTRSLETHDKDVFNNAY